MSTCTLPKHGTIFQSVDQVKRCNGLKLLNENGDIYFFWQNFGAQFIPIKFGKLEKNSLREKKIAKSVHKAHYSRMQIMTLKGTT